MSNIHQHPLPLPAKGTVMDQSGLFGLERGSDGLFRAVGPGGGRSAHGVIGDVAVSLATFWQPDGAVIADTLAAGDEHEALNEAHCFLQSWDLMAPGETLKWMFSRAPAGTCFGLPGIARVEARPDGLVYLVLDSGAVSRRGVQPTAAVMLVASWEGLDSAADMATENLSDPYNRAALAAALMVRWDTEVAAMPAAVRDLPVAA